MKTHKRFLGSGEAYPTCGAEIVVEQGPAAMADRWADVTCERCLPPPPYRHSEEIRQVVLLVGC